MLTFEEIKRGDKVMVNSHYLQGAAEVTIVPGVGSYRYNLQMVAVRLAGGTASFWVHYLYLERLQ